MQPLADYAGVTSRELCKQRRVLENSARQELAVQFPLLEDSLFTGEGARQGAEAETGQAALD